MAKFTLACALGAWVLGPCLAQDTQGIPPLPSLATDLGAADVATWRTHIRPDQKDLTFEIIPWLTTLADGIRAADAEQKPLLLWVMNGHPLGCT